MTNTEAKEKIITTMDIFGMTGVKASEIMGITHATFRNKKNDNALGHTFNEKNYTDLIEYLKAKINELP